MIKRMIFWAGVCMSGWFGVPLAQAQEGENIWVPAANVIPPEGRDAVAAEPGDALMGMVNLQRDLYRVVMTFDEQARRVEGMLIWYEQARIQNHEKRMSGLVPQPDPDTVQIDPETGEPVFDDGLIHFKTPLLCSELDESLRRYINKNVDQMEKYAKTLAAEAQKLTDGEKAETAERLRVALAAIPELRRAEEILYICLYKYKNDAGVPTTYSVEKTLRSWYMAQEKLVDAWIGNVD